MRGGSVARQLLRAGWLDELRLYVVPMLLGPGIRLLQDGQLHRIDLELIGADPTPAVIPLHYRIARWDAEEFPAGSS